MPSRLLLKFAEDLEKRIDATNTERLKDNLPQLAPIKITLMGQYALLVNQKINDKLTLYMTRDVDAIISGEWAARRLVQDTIKNLGMEYDQHSNEIWIPEKATEEILYQSHLILIATVEPIYIFLSKAIKAKEKNRFLIREALLLYGETLAKMIEQYGGEIAYFIEE